mmetsp:Transcript_2026/g.2542  ORF Transcript_2026/g.2542 Transcript_2026/m.2542 type:complete len:260 (+) Transcript_2026:173-952(+)|eukprot:CAMPEP_0172510082 /NCGR_PEP_ID=MMETSP1066-20121228/226042_1 /TAXON_ID=671091 /ORGANISM="Coscinodiscus wailesii, Strain CCMP2513" /LENGTH=259 /DNA_ID=CAMNT_0013288909 /DNA_START=169 /DNA_END=948 /DNA_ORIENTATION=-
MIVKPQLTSRLATSSLGANKLTAVPSTSAGRRGAFILLEGVDRCGKTTQCSLLLKHLLSLSIATIAFRFPNRGTSVGNLIDGYLKSEQNIDDRAVHLLFSANRWESVQTLESTLANGTSIVCDRYAYSGVAFSAAKEAKGVDLEWCKRCDIGLPAPDAVIFLDLDQDDAERRGGYGNERYEKRELQMKVRDRFADLQSCDEQEGRVPWHVIDASGSIEEVQNKILDVVERTMRRVSEGAPLKKMWSEGDYDLPPLSLTN